MIDCEHLTDGRCGIASKHGGALVNPPTEACAACCACARPKQLNFVTASLAIGAIGLPLPADKRHLLEHVRPYAEGPGTELKRLISWLWSPNRKCAKCADRVRKMNKWGVEKCRKRRHLIIAWLKQSARRNNIPFSELIAGTIVDRAISRAERNTKCAAPPLQVVSIQAPKHTQADPAPVTGEWVVAVTTAPRKEPTIERCLVSLRVCGWDPIVFAEPGSPTVNAYTITNAVKLGVWRNWLESAKWCIANTKAELILTVQDDSLFHPESRTFTESVLWPANDVGFLSLYTPKHYSIRKNGTVRDPGINRIVTRSLWGACALVWPREVLERVVEHSIALRWAGAAPRSTVVEDGKRRRRRRSEIDAIYKKRRATPEMIANSDTAIGKILNAMGRTMWFVDPSPVQHIARFSSIAHGDNSGRRNAWRIADHSISLTNQVGRSSLRFGVN